MYNTFKIHSMSSKEAVNIINVVSCLYFKHWHQYSVCFGGLNEINEAYFYVQLLRLSNNNDKVMLYK